MDHDLKSNKNSALVHQYTQSFFEALFFLLFTFQKFGMKDYGRPFEYQQSTLVTLMLRPI